MSRADRLSEATTAITIIYAFLASVLVLPSLLAVWTKYLGPEVSFDAPRDDAIPLATGDGGRTEEGSED